MKHSLTQHQMENWNHQCQTLGQEIENQTLNEAQAVEKVREMEQQLLEMKRLLKIGMKDTFLVLSIIDDGLLQRVIVREGFTEEFQEVIQDYLQDNGDEEGRTEDGYAVVYRINPTSKQEEENVWTYSFDGDESVEQAIQRLKSRH